MKWMSPNRVTGLSMAIAGFFGFQSVTFAGSAQWSSAPASSDWNTLTNWTPPTVPNGPSDIAAFGASNTTAVVVSVDPIEANGIVFNTGASPYTIATDMGALLTLSGAGITNNSGIMQTFITHATGSLSAVIFTNSAAAGTLTTFLTDGGTVRNGPRGVVILESSASAGDGTFINNGGTGVAAIGGRTHFYDNSTAAIGTFTNNGGAADQARGGETLFDGTSSAGNGTFNNNGATITPTSYATLTGGHTGFFQAASAENGTFNNNGGTVAGAAGGEIDFFGNSIAGNGVFNNHPAPVAGASGGVMNLGEYSNAANGVFTNYGANFSGTGSGTTNFFDGSTAGNGTFINNPGTVSGASGGKVVFFTSSSAGNGMFVNNGASVSGDLGGSTTFYGGGGAASSTLIAYGGTNGGEGGSILFSGGSGDTSRIEVFGNGKLDISADDGGGVTVGSIEGDGNAFLGGSNLTTGSNNLSTTFSGVIQDGGSSGGTAASLTKIGTGTLTLAAANTYTGTTTVNAGTLLVDGSVTSDITVNGGTLGGSGQVGKLTVDSGGVFSPGNGTGITHVDGDLTLNVGSRYAVSLTGSGLGMYSEANVTGSVALNNATLAVKSSFALARGTTFIIVNNDGTDPVAGTFNRLAQNGKIKIKGHKFRISYTGGDGNDVVLTAVK